MLDLNIYAKHCLYVYFTAYLCLMEHRDMKAREEMEVKLDAFLTSTEDGGIWQDLRLGHCNPGEMGPGVHRIGAWVGAGSGLNAVARPVS
jgi:hypothetical protein